MLPRGNEFSHLNSRGKVTLRQDEDFNILCFEINFDGYFLALVCLWPSNHPTSQPTPDVSSISLSMDSGDSGIDCQ